MADNECVCRTVSQLHSNLEWCWICCRVYTGSVVAYMYMKEKTCVKKVSRVDIRVLWKRQKWRKALRWYHTSLPNCVDYARSLRTFYIASDTKHVYNPNLTIIDAPSFAITYPRMKHRSLFWTCVYFWVPKKCAQIRAKCGVQATEKYQLRNF